MTTLLLLIGLLGCSGPPTLVDQIVPAGCGMCIYKIDRAAGCFWSVEIEEKAYPVSPDDVVPGHAQHAPDGMCNVERQARVSGQVKGGRFIADSFELLPLEEAPKNPEFTPEDQH